MLSLRLTSDGDGNGIGSFCSDYRDNPRCLHAVCVMWQVNEICPDGSEDVQSLLHEGLAACEVSLKAIDTRCSSCKYQTTALMAVAET